MKSSRTELSFQIPSLLNNKSKSFPKLYRNNKNPLLSFFFNFFYIYGLYTLFFVWTIGLSDCRTIGLSDYRTVRLSDCRTIGLSDYRTVGLSDCRTIGLSDYSYGPIMYYVLYVMFCCCYFVRLRSMSCALNVTCVSGFSILACFFCFL